MNYQHPELQASLAGEYVMGTLHGRARQRFEHLLEEDARLREQVRYWQQRLHPLTDRIAPIVPPISIWQQIAVRVGMGDEREHRSWIQRLGLDIPTLWPAAGVCLLVIAIAVVMLLPRPVAFDVDYSASIHNEQQQRLWDIAVDIQHQQLRLSPVAITSRGDTSVYELWLLPGDGTAPQSLGLLPTNDTVVIALSASIAWATANGLAVSIEPAGGSPTGLPTGPVVYQAAITAVNGS